MSGGDALRRLLRLVPSSRWGVAASVGAGIAAAVLLVAQTLLLSWIVRDVLLEHRALGGIARLAFATAGIMVARAICIGLREFFARRTAIRVKSDLRTLLAEKLLALGPAYTLGERTGDLVATATEGIDKLDAYVSRYLPGIVLGGGVPLLIVLAVLPVDVLSAGLLVFTVPVIVMLMILIGTLTRDHVQRQWETLGRLGSTFLDIVQGLETLLLLDRAETERSHVQRISLQFRDRTLSVLKVAFLSGAVLELMTAAGIGLIATVLGVRLLDGGIPFDRAFFVFLLTPEFYRPLRDLGTHRHSAMEGIAAAERMLEILETPQLASGVAVMPVSGEETWPNPTSAEGAAAAESGRARSGTDGVRTGRAPAIEFHRVSYVYPERERAALEGVSLTLEAGTRTALVGASGAGKSTAVSLLLRAMDPTGGEIWVDARPLSDVPLEEWRERVALVPQDPYLFSGTVRDNIRLARPGAGEDEVLRAARLAGCHSFIDDLPDGMVTLLGERGEGLSAGQRQRLAIARAFLKDAPLLLLDEPTSALDPESEAAIRHALAVLARDRTVLVVAHRMNTVRSVDRVAVLASGRLVETGTYDELVARGGVFAELTCPGWRKSVPA